MDYFLLESVFQLFAQETPFLTGALSSLSSHLRKVEGSVVTKTVNNELAYFC